MTFPLPANWRETAPRSNREGTWRFEIRNPGRFRYDTLRTVTLQGVKGVKMVAGKLQKGDQELERHGADSMVPQAAIYSKRAWPDFRDALQWNDTHFSRMGNPPGESPSQFDKRSVRLARAILKNTNQWLAGKITWETFGAGQRMLWKRADKLKLHHEVLRLVDPLSPTRLSNPPSSFDELLYQEERAQDHFIAMMNKHRPDLPDSEPAARRKLERMKGPVGEAYRAQVKAQNAVLEMRNRSEYCTHPDRPWCDCDACRMQREGRKRDNPEPTRVGQFRVSAQTEIVQLVTTETELRTAIVQALEMADRGAPIPDWLRDRIRGLQAEVAGKMERVKTAIARHGAALGEFSVPTSRSTMPPRRSLRDNPSGSKAERAAAVARFEEFHGSRPEHLAFRHIPDLTKLVALGDALEIHYRAHVPRGPRNTPYRHAFSPGATLLTDASGKALVILGNINVGRARGARLGYIRG